MLYLSDILNIVFFDVCRAHFEDVGKRYKNKARIQTIINHGKIVLRDELGEQLLPGISAIENKVMREGEENKRYPTNKEMLSQVCELKDQFAPADYLFLKALFIDDELEKTLLLQQTQMIAPENPGMYIISTFISLEDREEIILQSQHLNSLISLSAHPNTLRFIQLVNVFSVVLEKNNTQAPSVVAGFLNTSSLPDFVKFSILFNIKMDTEAPLLKKILDLLLIPNCENHWVYMLAQLHVSYEMKVSAPAITCY